MSIFGGVLPFLGFRRLSEEDRVAMDLPPVLNGGHWQTLEVEWLGCGVVLAAWMVGYADPPAAA